jgi:hypothetical protein
MQQELERFFIMSTAFTSKDPVLRGWVGPDAALDMVQRAINRYRERRQPGLVTGAGSGPAAGQGQSSAPSVTPMGQVSVVLSAAPDSPPAAAEPTPLILPGSAPARDEAPPPAHEPPADSAAPLAALPLLAVGAKTSH